MTRPELILSSRANPRFKGLKEHLSASGSKRTHTLLLGSKLIETWAESRPRPAAERLKPITGLRLDGSKIHRLEKLLHLETWILGEALMRDLAEAGSPPDCALLMEVGPEAQGPLAERVIVPWSIQDPGNLGAILRSAAAFGFQEVMLGPGCTDPFSPKALRGSMGAAFLMPVRRCSNPIEIDSGHWYALHRSGEALPIARADLSDPLRILVGNEGHGWRDIELPRGISFLSLPAEGVESLNAAVAAGIACFEAARRNAR